MGWFSRLFHKRAKQPQLTAEDCCTQGKQLFDAGKYLEAMEFFQVAIEKDAQKEEAYKSLIGTYRALGKEQDAERTIMELQKAIPNHKPITQNRKPIPPKQKPANNPPTPLKPKKSFVNVLFGEKIELSKKDKYAILAGGFFEMVVLVFSFFLGLEDELPLLWFLLFFFIYSIVSMTIIGETKTYRKQPGAGVTFACAIGGFISTMAPFFSLSFVGIPYLSIYLFLIICFVLSYTIGRFKRASKTQGRLFGYSLASIMLLLIILFSIPPIVKQRFIQEHIKSCEETLVLRNEHLQQDICLGFMGIQLGDYFPDVIQKMKNDTNVVSRIKLDKEPYGYLDLIDYNDYLQRCYVQARHIKLDFDKELQYDVTFNNHTDRLYILFFQDTVRHIQFNGGDDELYMEKYGLPECYYKNPPETFVTPIDRFPYFKKGYNTKRHYGFEERPSYIAQWSFANGVIRVNDHSVQYISNDVFDTIAARNERASREAERLKLEQEEKARQMELEKAKQEKEEAEKKALEQKQKQKQREEDRKRAMEQI